MKKIISSALILLALFGLVSCRTAEETKAPEPTSPRESESVSESATETEPPTLAGSAFSFYDDLSDNGTYTRLETWLCPWNRGEDIAVFDVIPSHEDSITSDSFKGMWVAEAEKLEGEKLPRANFILRYMLRDGSVVVQPIEGPRGAENANIGYIEVYLYDDVHQPDGAWYSHVTDADMTDETVFSSIKLTAGEKIDEVMKIELEVYSADPETETPSVLEITRLK